MAEFKILNFPQKTSDQPPPVAEKTVAEYLRELATELEKEHGKEYGSVVVLMETSNSTFRVKQNEDAGPKLSKTIGILECGKRLLLENLIINK